MKKSMMVMPVSLLLHGVVLVPVIVVAVKARRKRRQ